jgi:hypothetical protein
MTRAIGLFGAHDCYHVPMYIGCLQSGASMRQPCKLAMASKFHTEFSVCLFFGKFSKSLYRVGDKRQANRQCLTMCPRSKGLPLHPNIATQLDDQFDKVPQIKSTFWLPSSWTPVRVDPGTGTEDVHRAIGMNGLRMKTRGVRYILFSSPCVQVTPAHVSIALQRPP